MVTGSIWLRIVCECTATNFVDIGYFPDPDCSKLDVEGYKCWSCKKEFCFDEDADLDEAIMIEDGKPMTTFWCTH